MGVVIAGHSKDYALPKFLEMLEHCIYPDKDIDIAFAVDEYRPELRHLDFEPTVYQYNVSAMKGLNWATEIVYYGKGALNAHAYENNYDSIIWQGVDCYYESPESFQQLKETFEQHGGMVGGLVAGRNRPDYAVCRDFVWGPDGRPTTTQEDVDDGELIWSIEAGLPMTVYGYPGSDATFVSRDLLWDVSMAGYEHWHLRPNKDQPLGELGPEEWFTYRMVKDYQRHPLVDTRVRPWHLHEDLSAARYPFEVCYYDDLHYP